MLKTLLGDPDTPADEADVGVDVSLTDVRAKQEDLDDYTGELQARTSVRMTDGLTGPASNEPGTVVDFDFPFTVPCTATPEHTIGATCSASTSFDAIVPGSTPEGSRAIWELGDVQVYDGGDDGQASTGGNTLFAHRASSPPRSVPTSGW